MGKTDAILPGSPPRGNIKGRANHFSPSSLLASPLDKPSNMTRVHSLSLLPYWLAAGQTIFSSPTTKLSPKHYEESISNLWTIGVWEIILSSFIFPSKPIDPQRNKLDIFNSCFNFSILIGVLTTASQFLLWHSASLFLLNSTTIFVFLQLTEQGFLSSQTVNKLPYWKLSISSSTHLFFLKI